MYRVLDQREPAYTQQIFLLQGSECLRIDFRYAGVEQGVRGSVPDIQFEYRQAGG